MTVSWLGGATIWGIIGVGVADAQTPPAPPHISPPVTPLPVKGPPPPAAEPAAPDPHAPMVTVPEGEPLPTELPPPGQPAPDPVIQTDQGGAAQKQKREHRVNMGWGDLRGNCRYGEQVVRGESPPRAMKPPASVAFRSQKLEVHA